MKKRDLPNHSGQLTIFLGITIVLIISMMAFIINVGLFVKAKINLQNSVDSAAWSGAAVQARQLTNIAYLNWELRNNYKEWMLKYYYYGQQSLHYSANGNSMNFKLHPFWESGNNASLAVNRDNFDRYNVPSVCLHFNENTHNICNIYGVPGIPRFEVVGMPGISEHNESFLNTIVNAKTKDCSKRTTINFGVAMIWNYGTKTSIIPGSPTIASHKVGAWPMSIELALRIRNLEAIVNRPPVKDICHSGDCNIKLVELNVKHPNIPFDERPIKAFLSAYKNLDQELKREFSLTEISPISYSASANTLSGFLIPNNAYIGNTKILATEKHYLDLQAIPLNLATFFTSFVSTTGEYRSQQSGETVKTEGKCFGIKTAIPVPGYIFGFVKNPQIVTYYAVKGKSKFMGLFYPFKKDSIELVAYAAAKPYGGRVGPHLFKIETNSIIKPRSNQGKSSPYLSGLAGSNLNYKKGYPMPLHVDFWIGGANSAIGGVPGTNDHMSYAVPNLLYDLSHNGINNNSALQTLSEAGSIDSGSTETLGLYHQEQFYSFTNNSSYNDIDNSIRKVRAATTLEAVNYLIPSASNDLYDAESIVQISEGQRKYFAPLMGPETLYLTAAAVEDITETYINKMHDSITTFTTALDAAAEAMIAEGKEARGRVDEVNNPWNTYLEAAKEISGNECSLKGRFLAFFNNGGCGITPLKDAMRGYIESNNPTYYFADYSPPKDNISIMSAFMPGKRNGAGPQGMMIHPFRQTKAFSGQRNFYSTKFVALKQLLRLVPRGYGPGSILETRQLGTTTTINAGNFINIIDINELSDFGGPANLDH